MQKQNILNGSNYIFTDSYNPFLNKLHLPLYKAYRIGLSTLRF